MKITTVLSIIGAAACMLTPNCAKAQYSAADSVQNHVKGNRLSIGGYGEAAYTRNFYSDNVYRYTDPKSYKNDPSHGRFDIPHAVIYISYDFGKGWTMSSEIEFEHTGSGGAIEKEYSEGGEWEQEVEKGGEVELEQFWIQKSFGSFLNVRAGHIVVPVGLTNAHHEPLNYFTVYRPEGEATILPCTWHDTGISIWGRLGDFRYEVQMLAGLDAFMFDRENWIQGGVGSPFEFKVANKYGFAARIDNYTLPGLRVGLSGYYGQAMHNSYPHEFEGEDANGNKKTYDGTKGRVAIGAIDFTFNRYNWIVRGNADYGYLSNASTISKIKRNLTSNNAPYKKTPVGKNAVAVGIEAGYDVFSQIGKLREDYQKLYLFGRYEYYNSYIPAKDQAKYEYTGKNRMAFGVNYYPIPQIAVKAEYSKRFFKSQYNNEPSVSLGVAYQGFFL
jgi:hypothetical protein